MTKKERKQKEEELKSAVRKHQRLISLLRQLHTINSTWGDTVKNISSELENTCRYDYHMNNAFRAMNEYFFDLQLEMIKAEREVKRIRKELVK